MKTIITFIIFIYSSTILLAQQGSVVAGGVAISPAGSVSYSIGQINYEITTALSGTIYQGLQHPYEITLITSIQEIECELAASIYPNPTIDEVTLSISRPDNQNLYYTITDSKGQMIAQEKIALTKTNILMNEYANGIYFIKILTNNNIEVKVFKLIKNK